jgi:FkbM family methyltransferase
MGTPQTAWLNAHVGRPLIFDVGFFNGRDTLEYLRGGARVVAIEANPLLYSQGNESFAHFIATGQLMLVNAVLLGSERGGRAAPTASFYVHKNQPLWSSLSKAKGCRRHTRGPPDESMCTVHEVTQLTCRQLLAQYGSPHYMKLDIEGAEGACLRQLPHLAHEGRLPQYISLEFAKAKVRPLLPWMLALGYRRFKMVVQDKYGDWSGPWGEAARDTETGHAWRELERWAQAKLLEWPKWCDGWCDIHLGLDDGMGSPRSEHFVSRANSNLPMPAAQALLHGGRDAHWLGGWIGASMDEATPRFYARLNTTGVRAQAADLVASTSRGRPAPMPDVGETLS